ncbi:lycopene cyclase domain-containing protein [Halomarina litorea]|uniref:lycopene cyclase domain-containing protein n=1 Tax=Halomarina litorea TaxID=2961595 RepID=UPI0020C50314|nr:lycopene cyclase domain-containing protein [Halomarina sp. BCD28]
MTLSYPAFVALFFGLPIAALALTGPRITRTHLGAVVLLAVVTVVYATPWDNYLVARGVWTYGEGVVWRRLGYTPLSEYAIFVLQPLLIGLWFYRVVPAVRADVGTAPFPARPVGVGFWFALAFFGGALLALDPGAGYYLGATLLWIAPMLGLEWAFGGPALWYYRREQLLAVAVPTLFLWAADWVALHLGVWSVAPALSTGLAPFGLPVEEALFFLLTTVLVVHGLLLVEWVRARVAASG